MTEAARHRGEPRVPRLSDQQIRRCSSDQIGHYCNWPNEALSHTGARGLSGARLLQLELEVLDVGEPDLLQ